MYRVLEFTLFTSLNLKKILNHFMHGFHWKDFDFLNKAMPSDTE